MLPSETVECALHSWGFFCVDRKEKKQNILNEFFQHGASLSVTTVHNCVLWELTIDVN